MLSGVLRSRRAIGINLGIARAFVRLRKLLATNAELVRKAAQHGLQIVVRFSMSATCSLQMGTEDRGGNICGSCGHRRSRMVPLNLNLYRVKKVGGDYIVLTDDATDVRITFAGGSGSIIDNTPSITKEENAQFFKRSVPLLVGLETPVASLSEPRTVNLFMDHFVDLFGLLRSIPFPFAVSRIEVNTTSHS